MLYDFMTRWLKKGGGSLGECYIISGGGAVVLLYNVIWGRGLQFSYYYCINGDLERNTSAVRTVRRHLCAKFCIYATVTSVCSRCKSNAIYDYWKT